MSSRNKTISICGSIVLIATIIISVQYIKDWSGLTGWAFGALLWSEFVFWGGLTLVEWIAERSVQIIIRSALYTLLSLYAVINSSLSVLYIAFFKEAVTSFTIIQVVLHAIFSIAIVISLAISRSIYLSNEQSMSAETAEGSPKKGKI